jgi:hypothetical protein
VALLMMTPLPRLSVLVLLAAGAAAPASASFLGLSVDAFGLFHRPSPAFKSWHADYRFLHSHEMAAGARTVLDGVSSFGASAHVRAEVMLKQTVAGAGASFTLSLCGGDTVFLLSMSMPSPRVCLTETIKNNANTVGWTHQTEATATNISSASPEWCRALCCAKPRCSGYTYTDPQPNGEPGAAKRYMCWMQEGPTRVVPGGAMCSGAPRSPSSTGHCWSGLGNSVGGATWKAWLNGKQVNASGRPIQAKSQLDGLPPGFSGVPPVDVLIDGSVQQVFFNGEVLTLPGNNCSSTNASMSVEGADAVVRLDTWRMKVPAQA